MLIDTVTEEEARDALKKAIVVSSGELMDLWGLSRQTISNLVDQGLPKLAPGRFDLNEAWSWRYKRATSEMEKRLANLDLEEQETRLKRAHADIREIELAKLRGEMIELSHARDIFEKVITPAKTRLLAIPAKLAVQVVACDSVKEAHALLEKELTQALNDISSSNVWGPDGGTSGTVGVVSLDSSSSPKSLKMVRRKKIHPRRRKSR
jgi:phage terminase Nu1 subunit (DNA packaging protein)